jgi:hypothetical protein
MRPRWFVLAATVLGTACGESGGSASGPSIAKGDMCILPAYLYNDVRKCSWSQFNTPVCFRDSPTAVTALDWMCLVSPVGKLYLYASSTTQGTFHYPGWSFGPASRTGRQPAFKSTLSPKDETRCEDALAVRAKDDAEIGSQHPRYCADSPDDPDKNVMVGTIKLTARGMPLSGPYRGDAQWSSDYRWHVGPAELTADPSYAYRGMFYVRWKRETPPPRSGRTYTCIEAGFLFPTIAKLDDHTVGYHFTGGPGACPRPATCQVTVTGLKGDESYPVSGKFNLRNLTRGDTDCADAVDIDGTFSIPYIEL